MNPNLSANHQAAKSRTERSTGGPQNSHQIFTEGKRQTNLETAQPQPGVLPKSLADEQKRSLVTLGPGSEQK